MGIEMENKKELDAESITTVNVKDYPPSEAFTAEPPPAYHRPKSTSVQIARIAAFTIVACSIILGAFILAAAYVNSNSACQQALNEQMARMDELLEERAALGPQYQALVGEGNDSGDQEEQPSNSNGHQAAHQAHQASQNEVQSNDKDDGDRDGGDRDGDEPGHPVHLKLPLQLDFDEIAGALMDRNQRSRLNCVVEKRRADEVVDHQPRTVRLPFGLNLTTDPRYEHVSGERMAIFCESGHDQNQRHAQEMQGPTIVQAVPIHIQGQMAMAPQPQPQQQQQIPPQLVLQHMTQILMQQRMMEEQRRQQQQQQRMEEQQRRQHQQQMIQQHLMAQAAQAAQAAQQQDQQQASPSVHFMVPLNQPEGRAFQPNGSPMSIHQIPLHAAMAVEVDARDGEQVEIEGRAMPQAMAQPPHHPNGPHPPQRETHLLPIEVIEAGPFQPHQASLQPAPAEGLRPPHERPPIYVVPQQVPQQPPQMPQQAQQQIDAEEHRPHYVQPRSVRSVDDVFHKREKRMRRCACDCSC